MLFDMVTLLRVSISQSGSIKELWGEWDRPNIKLQLEHIETGIGHMNDGCMVTFVYVLYTMFFFNLFDICVFA